MDLDRALELAQAAVHERRQRIDPLAHTEAEEVVTRLEEVREQLRQRDGESDPGANLTAEELREVNAYRPLDTLEMRLAHALAWTLVSYEAALAGKPSSAEYVVSFAESVLREVEVPSL
jgi:hypothetical protein